MKHPLSLVSVYFFLHLLTTTFSLAIPAAALNLVNSDYGVHPYNFTIDINDYGYGDEEEGEDESYAHNLDSSPTGKRQTIFQAFIVCETTNGSPWTRDVLAAANTLANKSVFCRQNNPVGSQCTQMTDSGSAGMGICGDFKAQIHCKTAGKVGRAVADHCNWNGMAGGYGQYEWGRVVVYTV